MPRNHYLPLVLVFILLANSAIATDTTKTNDVLVPIGVQNKMTNAAMGSILKELTEVQEGSREGYWQVKVYNRILTIISDSKANRMRIMTGVVKQEDIKKAQYTKLLEAQFDRALEVKYALYDGVLWSVFIHPLGELTREQFIDALNQVFNGAQTFGTSYSSTDIVFGTANEEKEAPKKKKK